MLKLVHVCDAIPWALLGKVAMSHHCGVSCWPRWGVGQGCWVHVGGNALPCEQPIRPVILELLEHCAAANARDPPRALTAATTAPSPAQASGRTPPCPVLVWL